MVNDCGVELDCGGCDGQYGDPSIPGIMTCGMDALCHCLPEADTPDILDLCMGPMAEPAVNDWCVSQGGCVRAALCGAPGVFKLSDPCIYSGQAIPGPNDTSKHIWCCAEPG
jgi:hypothetical protein